jgi:hypothetical protein
VAGAEASDDRKVVAALRKAGVKVRSVYDLVRTTKPYPAGIPVLITWLPKVTNPTTKEGIVRALTVRGAGEEAARVLVDEFHKIGPDADDHHQVIKWTIGNALSEVADDAVVEELIDIAKDSKHGGTRDMVVLALGNMRTPSVVKVLLDLLDDSDVDGHAVMALGKLKVERAEARIARIAETHPKEWVRRKAGVALRRIARASAAKPPKTQASRRGTSKRKG